MVPLQTHGCYNRLGGYVRQALAVVPLQTHGCYNLLALAVVFVSAVVPLQTHGCYNDGIDTRRGALGRGSPTDSRVL